MTVNEPPPAIERRQEYRPRFPYAPSLAMVLAALRRERKASHARRAETPTAAPDRPPPPSSAEPDRIPAELMIGNSKGTDMENQHEKIKGYRLT